MKRTERFGLLLSSQEKTVVTRLAEHEGGLSQAALLRMLIRRAAVERGFWPMRHVTKTVPNKQAKEAYIQDVERK